MIHGPVTLQRLKAEPWRLCCVLFLLITTHLQSERKNTVSSQESGQTSLFKKHTHTDTDTDTHNHTYTHSDGCTI